LPAAGADRAADEVALRTANAANTVAMHPRNCLSSARTQLRPPPAAMSAPSVPLPPLSRHPRQNRRRRPLAGAAMDESPQIKSTDWFGGLTITVATLLCST
jgi:hypothetical protein